MWEVCRRRVSPLSRLCFEHLHDDIVKMRRSRCIRPWHGSGRISNPGTPGVQSVHSKQILLCCSAHLFSPRTTWRHQLEVAFKALHRILAFCAEFDCSPMNPRSLPLPLPGIQNLLLHKKQCHSCTPRMSEAHVSDADLALVSCLIGCLVG